MLEKLKKRIRKAKKNLENAVSNILLTDLKKTEAQRVYADDLIEIICLSGIGRVRGNCYAVREIKTGQIIILDCGSVPPSSHDISFKFFDMKTLDLTKKEIYLPDTDWLTENWTKIQGFFITHGHLDHSYILPEVFLQVNGKGKKNYPPIFASKLTGVLMQEVYRDPLRHKNLENLKEVNEFTEIKVGNFTITPFEVPHSIPQTYSFVVNIAGKNILYMADFKFNLHSREENLAFHKKLKKIAQMGIDILMMEALNIFKNQYTRYETVVFRELEKIIKENKHRVIFFTCLSSNIARIKKIIDICVKIDKTCQPIGRSIRSIIEVANSLDIMPYTRYITKDGENKPCYIIAGSQGEINSALEILAQGKSKRYEFDEETEKNAYLAPGNLVIIAQSIIPDNEKQTQTLVKNLISLDVRVVMPSNDAIEPHANIVFNDNVHVSGHEYRDGLAEFVTVINPKIVANYHGTWDHIHGFERFARDLGYNVKLSGLFFGREEDYKIKNEIEKLINDAKSDSNIGVL